MYGYFSEIEREITSICSTRFIPIKYSEGNLKDKQECREYQEKIKEIVESPDKNYDVLQKFQFKTTDGEIIEIEVTPRQLANAGIFPDLCKEKKEIHKMIKDTILDCNSRKQEVIAVVVQQPKENKNVVKYEDSGKMYISSKMLELYEKAGVIPANIHTEGIRRKLHELIFTKSYTKFKRMSGEEYDEKDKLQCRKIERKIKRIVSSSNKKYDKVQSFKFRTKSGEEVVIQMTPRQLAQAGILPELCKDKTSLKPKDIARASKGLSSSLISNVKDLFSKLEDKDKSKGGRLNFLGTGTVLPRPSPSPFFIF